MKSIQLNKENLVLNGITITGWSTINEKDFLQHINSSSRTFDIGHGATIYVFDTAGLRFWKKNGVLYQGQVVLEKNEDEKFPILVYDGSISIDNMPMTLPVTFNQLDCLKDLTLKKDSDSIQYGVHIYSGFLGTKHYIFYMDKNNEYVSSIWF